MEWLYNETTIASRWWTSWSLSLSLFSLYFLAHTWKLLSNKCLTIITDYYKCLQMLINPFYFTGPMRSIIPCLGLTAPLHPLPPLRCVRGKTKNKTNVNIFIIINPLKICFRLSELFLLLTIFSSPLIQFIPDVLGLHFPASMTLKSTSEARLKDKFLGASIICSP